MNEASSSELMPFFDHAQARIREAPAVRVCGTAFASDVVFYRHIVIVLYEYLLKPAVAMEALMAALGAHSVKITSALSAVERMAKSVAEARGLPVTVLPASLVLRFLSWLKSCFKRNVSIGSNARINGFWSRDYGTEPVEGRFDVLLVCEEERRFNRAVELAGELGAAGKRCLIVVVPFKEEAARRLEALGKADVRVAVISQYLTPAEREEIYPRAVLESRAAWEAMDGSPEIRKFRFRGMDIWDQYSPKLRPAWEALNVLAAYSLPAAARCLERHGPAQVILLGNNLYANAFREMAMSQGVKAIWYCDNPILANMRFWPETIPRYFPVNAVLATSEFLVSGLVNKFNYAPERVFLLGESQAHLSKVAAPTFRIESARPRILALSTYVANDVSARRRMQFHKLVAAAVKAAQFDLVIRAHPNENLEGLKADLAAWGISPVFLSQRENIQDVLSQVDLACMIFSQAGLEVLRAGKPLVAFQSRMESGPYESFIPYVSRGAAAGVDADSATAEEAGAILTACALPGATRDALLARGQEFFRSYSTASLNPADLARFTGFMAPASSPRA